MIAFALALLVTAPPMFEGKLVWSLPAGQAIVHNGTIALWAPDFRSVLGVDAKGQRKWRVATGDQGGYRTLEPLGDNVLAYAGEEALLIAPASGKVLGKQPHVTLASPGKRGCRIEAHAGACGLACECSFLPLRCEDLGPAAARATIPMFEEWDTDGHRSSQCMGTAGRVLGKSGPTIVVELPLGSADPKQFGLAKELVGLDPATAKARWRSQALNDGLTFEDDLSGALADGKTCYLGTRSGSLRVFDCQRAVELWKKQLTVPAGAEPQVEPLPDGLVVRDGTKAKRLAADGHVVWEVEVPKNELILLSTDKASRYRRFSKLVAAQVLDPANGAKVARLAFLDKQARWPIALVSGQGWIALGDEAYTVLRSGTTTTVKSPAFIEELVPGTTMVARRTHDGIAVDALATNGPRDLHIDGTDIVAVEGLVGEGRILVVKDGAVAWDPKDPKSFGELRLYDLKAALARTAP